MLKKIFSEVVGAKLLASIVAFTLVALMAVAEGPSENGKLLDLGSELNSTLNTQHSKLFISEAEIPTDLKTWHDCCSHRDCMEARVVVSYQDADWAKVAIANFPVFKLETRKVLPSKNGKDYFCRADLTRPPDKDNTRCVFISRPNYVRAR